MGNRRLVGLMAQYEITQQMLSKELEITTKTLSKKIKTMTFTQKEIIVILKYLKQYTNKLDLDIFFEDVVDKM